MLIITLYFQTRKEKRTETREAKAQKLYATYEIASRRSLVTWVYLVRRPVLMEKTICTMFIRAETKQRMSTYEFSNDCIRSK
jgi:hypothetical protein